MKVRESIKMMEGHRKLKIKGETYTLFKHFNTPKKRIQWIN